MIRYLRLILFASIITITSSCKVNRVVNGNRQGKWFYTIEQVENEVAELKSKGQDLPEETIRQGYYYKGRYRKGQERGIWRYFMNGKLIRKEKYRGNTAFTRFYYPNGQVDCEGKTVFDISQKMAHWYYSGEWNYFDENGKLVATRLYDKGKLTSEIYHDKDYQNGN